MYVDSNQSFENRVLGIVVRLSQVSIILLGTCKKAVPVIRGVRSIQIHHLNY